MLLTLGPIQCWACKCQQRYNNMQILCKCKAFVFTRGQTFYTCTYISVTYIYIYITLTQGLCKYLSNTFTWPCVNVLEHVGVHIRVICKVILVDIRWKFKHRHIKNSTQYSPPPPTSPPPAFPQCTSTLFPFMKKR